MYCIIFALIATVTYPNKYMDHYVSDICHRMIKHMFYKTYDYIILY